MNLQSKFGYFIISSSPKLFKILHFVCKRDGITDRQRDRQTNGQTNDPITRCPRRTFLKFRPGRGVPRVFLMWTSKEAGGLGAP